MSGLALASFALLAAPSGACLHNGDAVTGAFGWMDARHPNGTRIHDPILTLKAPRCFEDDAGRAEGRQIQLVFDRAAEAKAFHPGATLTVTGEFMVPHTAWHIGDIVVLHAKVIATSVKPAPQAKPRR